MSNSNETKQSGGSGEESGGREIRVSEFEVRRHIENILPLMQCFVPNMRGINFKYNAGGLWAFEPDTNTVHYSYVKDNRKEQGVATEQVLKESLFAIAHELMCHWGLMLQNPELYMREFNRTRSAGNEHLELLYNVCEDVLGNHRVVANMPYLKATREALYRNKLFPGTDYREDARHNQFVWAFLRRQMLPNDETIVDDDVEEALLRMRNYMINGKKYDLVPYITEYPFESEKFFTAMRHVEVIYNELYKKDLEDPKPEKKSQGEGGQGGSGKGKPKNEAGMTPEEKAQAEKARTEAQKGEFKKEREDRYYNNHPHPFSDGVPQPKKKSSAKKDDDKKDPEQSGGGEKNKKKKEKKPEKESGDGAGKKKRDTPQGEHKHDHSHPHDLERQIREAILSNTRAEADKTPEGTFDERMARELAKREGVSQKTKEEYNKLLLEVSSNIEELVKSFEVLLAQRLKRILKKTRASDSGELLDPVGAYIAYKAGDKNAKVFSEDEYAYMTTLGEGVIDFSIVCDGSGSMDDDKRSVPEGKGKLIMQKKSVIVIMETIARYQEKIEEMERKAGVSLGLSVRSQVLQFYGEYNTDKADELKGFDDELAGDVGLQNRMRIFDKLSRAQGGTPDHLPLQMILNGLSKEQKDALAETPPRLRKVVMVLSDGESNPNSREPGLVARLALQRLGTIVIGLGMGEKGGAVLTTYGTHGGEASVIADVNQLPESVGEILLRHSKGI
jgi:hypothetical protein